MAARGKLGERMERFLVGLVTEPNADRSYPRSVRVLLLGLHQISHVYRTLVQLRLFLYAKGILRHNRARLPGDQRRQPYRRRHRENTCGRSLCPGSLPRKVDASRSSAADTRSRNCPSLRSGLTNFLLRESRRPPRIVSDGEELLLDSAMSGDEPYMLATNLPNVPVLVDKDRVKSGRYAINKFACDTLVLDDGFQYMGLKHRTEVVLVDCSNPFGNEHMLPRGVLREPVHNIQRADFIFLTKSRGTGKRRAASTYFIIKSLAQKSSSALTHPVICAMSLQVCRSRSISSRGRKSP